VTSSPPPANSGAPLSPGRCRRPAGDEEDDEDPGDEGGGDNDDDDDDDDDDDEDEEYEAEDDGTHNSAAGGISNPTSGAAATGCAGTGGSGLCLGVGSCAGSSTMMGAQLPISPRGKSRAGGEDRGTGLVHEHGLRSARLSTVRCRCVRRLVFVLWEGEGGWCAWPHLGLFVHSSAAETRLFLAYKMVNQKVLLFDPAQGCALPPLPPCG